MLTILHVVYRGTCSRALALWTLALAPTANNQVISMPSLQHVQASVEELQRLSHQVSHDPICDIPIVQRLLLWLMMGVPNLYVWEYHVCLGNVIVSTQDRRQADLRVRLPPVWANAAEFCSVDREYHLLTGKDAQGAIAVLTKNIMRDSVPNVNMQFSRYFWLISPQP